MKEVTETYSCIVKMVLINEDTAAFTAALQNEVSNNSEQPMDTGGEQQMETSGNADQQTESTNNEDDMNVD